MEYEAMIQSVLDDIDCRITENIRVDELARTANYSTYHFCRIFMAMTGTPVMSYVTRRKLEYAQYDLSRGKRIIDVAMDYGFDTHAGFTKAFNTTTHTAQSRDTTNINRSIVVAKSCSNRVN